MSPRFLLLFALALLFTLLNALKPLHGDDGVYYVYASQAAAHPLDPYGFDLEEGMPANHTLAPPVAPYWWSLGIRLFGQRPFLWKLWMLPFGLLFVFSLAALFRRFAPELELPLTGMTVLSPAFLPAWNLMLDVPALGLSLCALAVFFRACDRRSLTGAVLAGLVAGVAMQTKYTAFVVPAVVLLYAVVCRRLALGLVVAVLAVLLFVCWETTVACRYGESHFVYAFGRRHGAVGRRMLHLVLPLIAFLGGLASPLALLGLAGLRVPRRAVWAAGALVALGHVLLALVPESCAVLLSNPATGSPIITLNTALFGSLGVTVRLIGGAVVRQFCRGSEGDATSRRLDWFLVGWLGLELAASFTLSPFPGARRLMGLLVVGTVLAGRLAARTGRGRGWAGLVGGIVAGNIALGFLYYGTDLLDARAGMTAPRQALRWIRRQDPGATVWYHGWRGYLFYAERTGMHGAATWKAPLRPGDWYVVDSRAPPGDDNTELTRHLQPVRDLEVSDALPLRTTLCYACGHTPLEHYQGARYALHIYRLR